MVLQVASQEVEFWALLRCCVLGYEHFDEAEFSDRSWGLRRFGRRRRRRFLPRIALALRPLPANDARNTLNFSD